MKKHICFCYFHNQTFVLIIKKADISQSSLLISRNHLRKITKGQIATACVCCKLEELAVL